ARRPEGSVDLRNLFGRLEREREGTQKRGEEARDEHDRDEGQQERVAGLAQRTPGSRARFGDGERGRRTLGGHAHDRLTLTTSSRPRSRPSSARSRTARR